uniref:Uncharacterized protein n=1 Tax=Stegastes partitus TaxID=144197 RepID=A0A3B5BDG2_9TELE
DSNTDSSKFEVEPQNELVVGRNVCLSSIVKSSMPDSFIWFAQDSNGAIWKLDLSFSNKTLDPARLFSFHRGAIQSLDVSKTSHLMATIAMDCSVKVFDFLEKRELTTVSFGNNATTLRWAPLSVNESGSLLLIGFEDGVVRVLEFYDPQKLYVLTGRSSKEEAKLRLRQVVKPHNAAVTAVAYDRNGEILATGSVDCTVFFFTVEDEYQPIGFIHVPGAVQALEWSPHSHVSLLLILCQSGHVVEVQRPHPEAQQPAKTFHLSELPRRSFRFGSIKSQLQETIRRQVTKKMKKKEREKEESQQPGTEEEEEELPPLCSVDTPSPLYCGFYSLPGQFWLSMVHTLTHTLYILSPQTFPPSSIESALQNLQKDRLRQEAELKLQEKRKKLAEIQKKYEQVLKDNQSLPEHVRLTPEVKKARTEATELAVY